MSTVTSGNENSSPDGTARQALRCNQCHLPLASGFRTACYHLFCDACSWRCFDPAKAEVFACPICSFPIQRQHLHQHTNFAQCTSREDEEMMSACVFEAALREPEKCEQLLKHARELRSVQAALQHEQLADASQREADQLKQQVAELRRENQSLTRHQVGLQQQLERMAEETQTLDTASKAKAAALIETQRKLALMEKLYNRRQNHPLAQTERSSPFERQCGPVGCDDSANGTKAGVPGTQSFVPLNTHQLQSTPAPPTEMMLQQRLQLSSSQRHPHSPVLVPRPAASQRKGTANG